MKPKPLKEREEERYGTQINLYKDRVNILLYNTYMSLIGANRVTICVIGVIKKAALNKKYGLYLLNYFSHPVSSCSFGYSLRSVL